MKHNTGVSNIEITDQNIRAFSATAKKYGIRYRQYGLPALVVRVYRMLTALRNKKGPGSRFCFQDLFNDI